MLSSSVPYISTLFEDRFMSQFKLNSLLGVNVRPFGRAVNASTSQSRVLFFQGMIKGLAAFTFET